jgi:hypothetical protein
VKRDPGQPRRSSRISLALNPGYDAGMTISATAVRFDEHTMWVALSDGRTLGVPLAWFPRLLHASADARQRVEISRIGLHWDELDEDISIARLLAGRGDMTKQSERAV